MEIDIKKGFLQGDTYSSVGFCCKEIPVMLLEESDGYKMCQPDKREIKRTRSLFVVDLKTYQQNHQKLKMTIEILVQEVWIPEQYRVYKNKLKLYLKMVG